MRRIAVINQKGGVGKTTTSVNLGAALAEQGRRVTVVDMDPQGNVGLALGIDSRPRDPSTYTVLLGQTTFEQARIATARPGLSVVPSNIDLSGAELELASTIGRETLLSDALKEWNEAARGSQGRAPADYVLFDCPPSLGLLSVNALAAADEVLLTVQTEFLALMGMSKLVEIVQLIRRRLNPDLKITGIVPCLYDSRLRLAREVLAEIRKYFPGQVFRHPVRTNVKLAEAPSFGASILDYAPESNGALDYRRVALEVIAQEERDAELAGLPAPRPLHELPRSRPGEEPPPREAPEPEDDASAAEPELARTEEDPEPEAPAPHTEPPAAPSLAPREAPSQAADAPAPASTPTSTPTPTTTPATRPTTTPATTATATATAPTTSTTATTSTTTPEPRADDDEPAAPPPAPTSSVDAGARPSAHLDPRFSPREPGRELVAAGQGEPRAAVDALRGAGATPAIELPPAAPAFQAPHPRALVAYLGAPRSNGPPERERSGWTSASGEGLATYVVPRPAADEPAPRPQRSAGAVEDELRVLRAADLPPLPREAFGMPHGASGSEG